LGGIDIWFTVQAVLIHGLCSVLISVIDFCLTKTVLCDPVTNYPSLQLQWASQGNCQQRKGTALWLLLIVSVNLVLHLSL